MKTVILLILTAIFWGMTPILEKIGLTKTDPMTGLTIRSIVVMIVILTYTISTGTLKKIFLLDNKTLIIFAVSGVLAGVLGMITYFHALQLGATSKIVPIAATYPLVTAVLSVLILGESISLVRILGTAFIVIGIWLVKSH